MAVVPAAGSRDLRASRWICPVSSAPPQARPDKPIFLSVKPDLTLALGNDDVPRGALQATLDRQTNSDRQQRIFLRADGVVAYRDLMGVMNLLRGAGYLKVALVGLEDTGQGSAIGGQLPGASSAAQQAAPATQP